MNIAIFTDTYFPDANGIAVSAKLLADVLKEHGHNVLVVTSSNAKNKPSNENGVYYLPSPNEKRKNFVALIGKYQMPIYRLVRTFKPDVVHNKTNGFVGQLGKYAAKKLRIPLVYTYHVHYEEYAPYVGGGAYLRLVRARERRYFAHMAKISTEFIAPSIKIKNYLRKKGIDKSINVIPTAILPKDFEMDESVNKDVKYIRKKYDIKDDEKVVLYIGNLTREKNIDLLINAFDKFNKQCQKYHAHLLILGEGPRYDDFADMIRALDLQNRIHLVGKVNHDKVKSYYAASDVFASPSTSETQNITIMEAMIARCLVLAKEDESLIGVLEEGETGYTFTGEEHFVHKLEKLFDLDNKEVEAIKDAAQKFILENYSVDKFYERVIEVYENAQRKNW